MCSVEYVAVNDELHTGKCLYLLPTRLWVDDPMEKSARRDPRGLWHFRLLDIAFLNRMIILHLKQSRPLSRPFPRPSLRTDSDHSTRNQTRNHWRDFFSSINPINAKFPSRRRRHLNLGTVHMEDLLRKLLFFSYSASPKVLKPFRLDRSRPTGEAMRAALGIHLPKRLKCSSFYAPFLTERSVLPAPSVQV